MWTRRDLKSRARSVLKLSYWRAFLVSLVIAFAQGSLGGSSRYEYHAHNPGDQFTELIPYLPLIISAAALVILLVLALRIFLGYPLEVGGRRYFVRSIGQKFDLNALGFAFNKARYLDIILAMLWRSFINFLWYLLLIIPGIIKFYSYRLVPYILADNPNIGYRRALELSARMTHGHKWAWFVLDLSFLGWYLLGLLAFVIGTLFVLPYQNATNAELYAVLRQNAIAANLTSQEELGLDNLP
ncbi:MAG: DUF975 family protein [Syntrophomonadaceae bacterium]